jgi:hypothetical protein
MSGSLGQAVPENTVRVQMETKVPDNKKTGSIKENQVHYNFNHKRETFAIIIIGNVESDTHPLTQYLVVAKCNFQKPSLVYY